MKLTPWFPYDQAPARVGVYEVRLGVITPGLPFQTARSQTQDWYAFWNGKTFSSATGCKNRAYLIRGERECEDLAVAEWRGLAEEPKQ